jgi:hypothetical protein
MRRVLPALLLAAAMAGPAAAQHVVPGGHPYVASGTYVQFYDRRTGVPVGGPVPVSEAEFARRAAMVPPDAPVIGVRPAPSVTDLGIEHVRHGRPHARHAGPVRPHLYGPRHARRVHGPRPGYGTPVYVGPRRFAPAPFRSGRPVPGYAVVRVPRGGAHPHARPYGPRHPHAMPHRAGLHRAGPPPHHRMGRPHRPRVGAPHPGPRPHARAGHPPFGGY